MNVSSRELEEVNHLSPHILIFKSFLTRHLIHSLNKSLAYTKIFQIQEELPFIGASSKLDNLKYFSFIMVVAREHGLVKILQNCLVNKANLKHSKFLNLIPPSILEWLI